MRRHGKQGPPLACATISFLFFDDDDVNDDVDDVVGGLRGGNLGFLRAQTREARTPLGVRQYYVYNYLYCICDFQ